MDGYRVEPFDEQQAVSGDAVIGLWMREAGMPLEEARRRTEELLLVAIAPDGRPAGVSTAYLERSHELRAEVWYSRVFVAAAHRGGKLAIALAKRGREVLAERYAAGDRRGLGVVFEVQHDGLKTIDLAHWRRTGYTFIGENDAGDHVRVAWFPGAEAPEPTA